MSDPLDPTVPSEQPPPPEEVLGPVLKDRLNGQSDVQVVQLLLEELAEESEVLRSHRKSVKDNPTNYEVDLSVVCQRRIQALKEMASLILERTKISKSVDLEHPVVRETMDYVFGKFEAVLTSNSLPRPQIDVILADLAKSLQDWKTVVTRKLTDRAAGKPDSQAA